MPGNGLAAARWIALLVPLALIAGALGFQFIGHMAPCQMCMWQRWPHYAAIGFALLALGIRQRHVSTLFVVIAGLLIATSGVIGVLHAGVEYHWWPGFTPCTADLDSSGDILGQILSRPLERCDTAPWSLFGVSIAGFNALFSLAGAVGVFGALLARTRS